MNDHFESLSAPDQGMVNGRTDSTEVDWKTCVAEFMDVAPGTPSPEMIEWMLKVLQWPKGSDEILARLEATMATRGAPQLSASERVGVGRTIAQNARAIAIRVIPTLAHLDPMPPKVLAAHLDKIDESG